MNNRTYMEENGTYVLLFAFSYFGRRYDNSPQENKVAVVLVNKVYIQCHAALWIWKLAALEVTGSSVFLEIQQVLLRFQ